MHPVEKSREIDPGVDQRRQQDLVLLVQMCLEDGIQRGGRADDLPLRAGGGEVAGQFAQGEMFGVHGLDQQPRSRQVAGDPVERLLLHWDGHGIGVV
ncbi:hypothetical protein LDL08_18335 [Nonomuraea glycinis]|uniref:Uncharacterized protein n=1 Tax=Nonomuraea glycinis TaxID=2047744 RepID=A0A918A502_9ACTN|nr:hypothetical protein [Nonomuraea glycinis]MCA2178154.1 hypothetical protein [Nonomuraea glycinis]GGP05970.1 hypothetical protein GCM10012278_27490 [Nonomuraea glycinis]